MCSRGAALASIALCLIAACFVDGAVGELGAGDHANHRRLAAAQGSGGSGEAFFARALVAADAGQVTPVDDGPESAAPAEAVEGGGRIAYGRTARPGQFPYASALEIGRYSCSGSLVLPRVVLTAGKPRSWSPLP